MASNQYQVPVLQQVQVLGQVPVLQQVQVHVNASQAGGIITRKCNREVCLPCHLPANCGQCTSCKNPQTKKRCVLRLCPVYTEQLKAKAKKRGDLTCNRCGSTFANKSNKNKHCKKASCGKSAPSFGNLTTRCRGCLEIFPNKAGFDLHSIRMKQANDLTHGTFEYKCNLCTDLVFLKPQVMTKHNQYHTNLLAHQQNPAM